jgi:hypothetical protein
MKSLSMNLTPVSIQGSGLLHTNWWTAREKRDPRAEGRGSKFRTLQPSVFSLLHPSHYSRQFHQTRFVIHPQCPISVWFLSKELDSATHCVYSYRFY